MRMGKDAHRRLKFSSFVVCDRETSAKSNWLWVTDSMPDVTTDELESIDNVDVDLLNSSPSVPLNGDELPLVPPAVCCRGFERGG